MEVRYLVDSNCIIDFCNGKINEIGKEFLIHIRPEISIVTNIELFATKNISDVELDALRKFVSISVVHPVTTALVQTTVEIRQNYKVKLPDAIIAATAIANDLTLISRNVSDFKTIPALKIIDPYTLTQFPL